MQRGIRDEIGSIPISDDYEKAIKKYIEMKEFHREQSDESALSQPKFPAKAQQTDIAKPKRLNTA